jgi:hypothetical protein
MRPSVLNGFVLGLIVGLGVGVALYAFVPRPGETTPSSLAESVGDVFPEPLAEDSEGQTTGTACRRRTRARWGCEVADASGGTSVYDVTVTRDGCWIARAVELSGETGERARVLEGCTS